MELKVTIKDPIGLHARPASKLVNFAGKQDGVDVKLTNKEGKSANLKSLISVMALAVKTNEEVVIEATGKNEEKFIKEIKELMIEEKLI